MKILNYLYACFYDASILYGTKNRRTNTEAALSITLAVYFVCFYCFVGTPSKFAFIAPFGVFYVAIVLLYRNEGKVRQVLQDEKSSKAWLAYVLEACAFCMMFLVFWLNN